MGQASKFEAKPNPNQSDLSRLNFLCVINNFIALSPLFVKYIRNCAIHDRCGSSNGGIFHLGLLAGAKNVHKLQIFTVKTIDLCDEQIGYINREIIA